MNEESTIDTKKLSQILYYEFVTFHCGPVVAPILGIGR